MDIKRIRQMAKEQGINLAVQGLVCLPCEIKKYSGSIQRRQRRGGVAYVARVVPAEGENGLAGSA